MIQEQYVSFETAKLLKQKGFDVISLMLYIDEEHPFLTDRTDEDGNYFKNSELKNDEYSAPTQALAMRWLREVHNLFIQVCIIPHTTVTMEQKYYLFTVHKDRRMLAFRKDHPSEYYAIYEEACEAAIKDCLENLI